MTKEHDDIELSETYRGLATEKAPPELDRKVLSMAAREGRTRYGITRAWIRPVAWAATIALSVAIVLEVTRYSDVTAPPTELESAKAKDDGDLARDLDKRSDAPTPARVNSPPAAALKSAAEPGRAEPEASSPEPAAAEESMAVQPLEESVSDDFTTDEMIMLQEADERARMRAGEARGTLSPASASLVAITEKKEQVDLCDAEAREDAEAWYACIETLREDGLADAARLELELLRKAFPDFREPGAE